jgi:hypothetical protein
VRWFAKIVLIVLICLLILFSVLADLPVGQQFKLSISLGLYLKLVSLLAMVMAALSIWAHKRRVELSQKYRRADEVLALAEAAFERKKHLCDQMEKQLQEAYVQKEQGLDGQIDQVRKEYQQRLNVLKEQNLELKETVAKLMHALKKEKQRPV